MQPRPASDVPPDITVLPKASPLLCVISGPSGVGKDAIFEQLRHRDPGRRYAITVTTRPKRPGEESGVHYHFCTVEEFKALLAENGLLEWAEVYGNYYGVPRFELREAIAKERDVILKLDVQGAATVKRLVPEAILIFVAPHSLSELLERHARRKTQSKEDLALRLETARREMALMDGFDYVVINKQGELVRAVNTVESIIAVEKTRVHPRIFSLPE